MTLLLTYQIQTRHMFTYERWYSSESMKIQVLITMYEEDMTYFLLKSKQEDTNSMNLR